MAGSGGAARPGVVPGSWPSQIVAAGPAAHSASRLPTPKQPNAPAVASASSAGAGSAVRRAKSSRSAYGCPATMAAAAAEPRLRTSDSPSLIAGCAGPGGCARPGGTPPDPPGGPRASPAGAPPEPPRRAPAGPGTGTPAGQASRIRPTPGAVTLSG